MSGIPDIRELGMAVQHLRDRGLIASPDREEQLEVAGESTRLPRAVTSFLLNHEIHVLHACCSQSCDQFWIRLCELAPDVTIGGSDDRLRRQDRRDIPSSLISGIPDIKPGAVSRGRSRSRARWR